MVHGTALHGTALHGTALHGTVLHCEAMIARHAAALGLAMAMVFGGCTEGEAPSATATPDPTATRPTSPSPSSTAAASTTATTSTTATVPRSSSSGPTDTAASEVRVGAEVLADSGLARLEGKRVGAIVNQTSLVDGRRLIDAIADHDDIELVRLFAPEHGIDGSLAAGVSLPDSIDETTGVPIVSLYGDTRQPTPAQFRDLDVVIFDLQDVGSRSYTYVSTMGLAMQTAAQSGVEFMVLDRPNPAGGERVSGVVLEPAQTSFIGMYPLPNVHGLTVGELATLIVDQAWLPGLDDLELTVVAMQHWRRSQQWNDLGRAWIAPSPRLPSADIALLYTGMVLLAGTSISDGSGTPAPFTLAGAPFIDSGEDLARQLEARRLPGVRFEAATFTPEAIPGVSPSPPLEGVRLDGVRLVVVDRATIDPFAVAIELLVTCQALMPAGASIITDAASFDLVAGSTELRRWIERGDSADDILTRLGPALDDFEQLRSVALLYP